jgi:stearoyl-CoA desaturase (Delta-9 desaturase)
VLRVTSYEFLPAATVTIFWIVQASALLVFTVPFRWELVALWAGSHFLRAVGLTLAFHRYYAHRAFQMNRVARFFWTLAGTAAMQKGPLWWAGHHVYHHKYADRDGDPHSPKMSGFYHAHFGWFLNDSRYKSLHPSNPVVRAFGSAPEIVFLERYYFLPPLALAVSMYAIGGWDWLIWGFCLPTMTLAHATFAINTVNHLFGSRRFQTQDDSTNNPLTALFAAGEGWHNNHHRYQRAARNGFYWWEYDITWYTIWAMAKLGLAWDVQAVPERIYSEARFTGSQVPGFTGSDVDDVAEPVNLRTREPVNL